MIVYQISLPKKKNADDFARFMKEEYLPSVHKGQTRAGQVSSLLLLQKEGSSHEFLLEVGWDGVSGMGIRLDDETVEETFAAYGAKLKTVGTFAQLAEWPQ